MIMENTDNKGINLTDNIKIISADVKALLQNIADGYGSACKEYFAFISADTVDLGSFFAAFNRVRLFKKLHSASEELIAEFQIRPSAGNENSPEKENLQRIANVLKGTVSEGLKQNQKDSYDVYDIDDEEQYFHIQNELRIQKRQLKKFEKFLAEFIKTLESYVEISINSAAGEEKTEASAEANPDEKILDESVLESRNIAFSEDEFYRWLVSDGAIAERTARQYLSGVHLAEKFFNSTNGRKIYFFGNASFAEIKSAIKLLLNNRKFAEYNRQRHNYISAALRKYVEYAKTKIDNLDVLSDLNELRRVSASNSAAAVIRMVDFDNPNKCTSYKPNALIFMGERFNENSWRGVYKDFLRKLYCSEKYEGIIKSLFNKPILGSCVEFTQMTDANQLRTPLVVMPNFYAEGNLSAANIIKRIKYVMDLCSLRKDRVIIEYNALEKDNENNDSEEIKSTVNNAAENIRIDPAAAYDRPIESVFFKEKAPVTAPEKVPEKLHEAATEEAPVAVTYYSDEAPDNSGFVLYLNGNRVSVCDADDALKKVCEFAINCKPFAMAGMAERDIKINGTPAFYRKPETVGGYKKLSNNLQIIDIDSPADLRKITGEIKKYCSLDNDMIAIKGE